MTRSELAQGICSEKYVYMIEKGDRSPFADIIRMISNRLGVDLFDYYDYLDCEDPILVEENMRIINNLKAKGSFLKLKEVCEGAMQHNDFRKRPWKYELDLSHTAYKVLSEGNYEEGIEEIKDKLEKIEKIFLEDVIGANYYLLLGTAYQMAADYDNAHKINLKLREIVSGKEKIMSFSQVIIGSKINTITLLFYIKDFEGMLAESLALFEYQKECGNYEQVIHTYFYLAYAYLENGDKKTSLKYFKKGMYISILSPKLLDIYYIRSFPHFSNLFNDESISEDLKKEFIEIYDAKDH